MVSEAPARDDPAYVDAPDGHTQSRKKSGMVPVYSTQKVECFNRSCKERLHQPFSVRSK